jgi:hypothetical protein
MISPLRYLVYGNICTRHFDRCRGEQWIAAAERTFEEVRQKVEAGNVIGEIYAIKKGMSTRTFKTGRYDLMTLVSIGAT